jgi:hypothetical protein
MRVVTWLGLGCAVLVMAGCGSEPPKADTADAPTTTQAPADEKAAEAAPERLVVSREEVEMAHRCRGLVTAVWAAKKVMTDAWPETLGGLSSEDVSYWTKRVGLVTYEGMTSADEDALFAGSVKIIATPEAVAAATDAVAACMSARQAG